MRYISYRSRLRLRTTLITLVVAVLVLIGAGTGLFIYLQRYIVYTPDGAHLDFDAVPGPAHQLEFDVEKPPLRVEGASLLESSEVQPVRTLERISGVYADGAMLSNLLSLRPALTNFTEPTAVMLDVRSIYGNFYYPSAVTGADTSTMVDPESVGSLIRELAGDSRVYLIACLPAFRDSAFALANPTRALCLSGGALWMDSEGCYWANPVDDEVIVRLGAIARELESLGFSEVVFSDFYYPASDAIANRGEGTIVEAAQKLAAELENAGITVSLSAGDPDLVPFARRIYLTEEDGTQVPSIVERFAGSCPSVEDKLIFRTASRDTRFSPFGILKPALGGLEN